MYYNKVDKLHLEEGEKVADKKFKITVKKYKGDTSVISLRLPIELVNTLDELFSYMKHVEKYLKI